MKRVNSESNTKQCLSIAESCASSTTVKKTNINIDDIKRYPTVTNPIKADDLSTPQAYAYSLRRAIVTDCTPEQRAELVELLNGKDTAEGVTFNNTKANRNSLHRWQNEQSRKERAAILGEGWQYVEGLNHGTQPGDHVTCIDGTRGRVTNATPECCVIEFETENGQRLTVAGYFRKERTPLQDSPEITQTAQDFADALEIKTGDRVLSKHYGAMATVLGREYDHRRKAWYYRVEFDTPQKGMDGTERKVTEFKRYGITKNYYPQGTAEIVGNAQYYAEQLKYGPASIIEYELAGVALRTESTREDVVPDSREGWGNKYRVTVRHQTGDTTETMTLSETAELLARMYQEEQGEAA